MFVSQIRRKTTPHVIVQWKTNSIATELSLTKHWSLGLSVQLFTQQRDLKNNTRFKLLHKIIIAKASLWFIWFVERKCFSSSRI